MSIYCEKTLKKDKVSILTQMMDLIAGRSIKVLAGVQPVRPGTNKARR